jgi:hypothetical protein
MGELRCARSVCLPVVLSAARHCVRSHAGHVTEWPRLGFPFARSAAAEVNYSYAQIGHAILCRHPITGTVQGGHSVTHSVADATRNWCFDSGRPAEINNLQRAARRLRRFHAPTLPVPPACLNRASPGWVPVVTTPDDRGRNPHVRHRAAGVHHPFRQRGSVAARGARSRRGK